MKKYLHTLRQKSYAEKSNIAFFASLAITGVIVSVWFLTIFANPTQYFEIEENNEIQNLANTGSLFDVFKEGFK